MVNLRLHKIRLVLNTVPDTAMLNALKTSNSSMDKPTFLDGIHPQVTQMLVMANGDHAALRWIFGKPILSQVLSLPIHVPMMDFGNAKTRMTVETPIDTEEFVIKMVAISTLTELVSLTSSAQDLTSRLIPQSQ